MCGIFGLRGSDKAPAEVAIGLRDLSYRGYDSWGIVSHDGKRFHCQRQVGLVPDNPDLKSQSCRMAMGHTRWSTHGEPAVRNAHPHMSDSGDIAVIHNGIIENDKKLRRMLPDVTFRSETDTEVIAHMLQSAVDQGHSLQQAVWQTAEQLDGRFAIVVMQQSTGEMLAIANGSPLVAAQSGSRQWVSSDTYALSRHSETAIRIPDMHLLVCQESGMQLLDMNGQIVALQEEPIQHRYEQSTRGQYKHFMRKEIDDQVTVLADCLSVCAVENWLSLVVRERLQHGHRIVLLGCGTSWHAALVAEYWLEKYLRIPVEVEYASEFRYRDPVITNQDIVIALSQSGETADTNAAVSIAKEKGAMILAICNQPGSALTRLADDTIYMRSGMEVGVAATKTFTTQLLVLYQLTLLLAQDRTLITETFAQEQGVLMRELPAVIAQQIQDCDAMAQAIARIYQSSSHALYLGRGLQFPMALEGALKLKEVSYIHAEGYPAAEMKHGPIALIDENMPVFVIATKDHTYEKVIANIAEVKTRKARVIVIGHDKDEALQGLAEHFITVPDYHTDLMPLLTAIPLQLLAYYMADFRGCDVDKPRNLAKSVTVE